MADEFKKLLSEATQSTRLLNYLSNVNRGLRREVEILQAQNKSLKEQAILIHERKVTERIVIYGRL